MRALLIFYVVFQTRQRRCNARREYELRILICDSPVFVEFILLLRQLHQFDVQRSLHVADFSRQLVEALH